MVRKLNMKVQFLRHPIAPPEIVDKLYRLGIVAVVVAEENTRETPEINLISVQIHVAVFIIAVVVMKPRNK